MNNPAKLIVSTLLMAFWTAPAWTQESDEEEPSRATIRLMTNAEANLPDAVTKEIALPDNIAENSEAVINAAEGLRIANQNRLEGNSGIERALDARQDGIDRAESAQEDRGRSADRPDPPEPPEPPGGPGN